MGSYVDSYYSVERFQAAYDGIVANITDKSQWISSASSNWEKERAKQASEKQEKKPAAERSGKATRQSICKGCGEPGHMQGSWRCSLTGTKKR
jgi:hypothetical protein